MAESLAQQPLVDIPTVTGGTRFRPQFSSPRRRGAQDVAYQDITPAAGGRFAPLESTLVLGLGGTGKEIVAWLHAEAAQNGVALHSLVLDSDGRLPMPRLLRGGGVTVEFPPSRLVHLTAHHQRDETARFPRLRERMAPLLRGIDAYRQHVDGLNGSGGYPVLARIDYELAFAEWASVLSAALQRAVAGVPAGPDASYYAVAAGAADAEPRRERRLIVLIVGSGCGGPGACGFVLVPATVRRLVADLTDQRPLIVGALCGPNIYANLSPRARSNWLASLLQLDDQRRQGVQHVWHAGLDVTTSAPPFDRLFLFDRQSRSPMEGASSDDLLGFTREVAQSLFLGLHADLFTQIEALVNNEKPTPYATLRSAVAHVDWPLLAERAAAHRAARGLRALLKEGSAS